MTRKVEAHRVGLDSEWLPWWHRKIERTIGRRHDLLVLHVVGRGLEVDGRCRRRLALVVVDVPRHATTIIDHRKMRATANENAYARKPARISSARFACHTWAPTPRRR